METLQTQPAYLSSFSLHPSDLAKPLPLPEPRVAITIRAGTMDDVPFMDSLQKKTTKQVGWMPTKQFEGKIKLGHVLIAETGTADCADDADLKKELSAQSAKSAVASRVGYLIGNDQYFKRDDVGIIYQINVVPEYRRSLVAASLLKAQFERSAYGCRLYCCWCAQDIEANRFWESMGFVPLAYRAGGTGGKSEGRRMKDEKEGSPDGSFSSFSLHTSSFATKTRVHIFWQKRIRQNDTTTPWWFPSKTDAGAMREDRIVLPIPPGTHWSDAKPLILPGETSQKELDHEGAKDAKGDTKNEKSKKNAFVSSSRSSRLRGESSGVKNPPRFVQFGPPGAAVAASEDKPVETEKPKRQKKPKVKTDPRLIAAARELRDRYLEHDYATQIMPVGKYDVSRSIEATTRRLADSPVHLLAA